MSVRQMSSKYLIVAMLLVAICLGALVFYGWQGGQAEENEADYYIYKIKIKNNSSFTITDITVSTLGSDNSIFIDQLQVGQETHFYELRKEAPKPGEIYPISYMCIEGNYSINDDVKYISITPSSIPETKVFSIIINDENYEVEPAAENIKLKFLKFETISHATYGMYGYVYGNHEYLVIENSEEWNRVWLSSIPVVLDPPPPPEIDFSTYTVIAVFMGAQPSGGHHIAIERIIDMENEIIVNVKEVYPGRCVVTLAFTYPHHVIKIELVQKPIVFEVQQFLVHLQDENGNPYDEEMYELVGEHRVEPGSGPPEPSI